jgi:SAM-dependent methyltransferase
MLAEARRVLKPGGVLVMGFIDRDSPIGQGYVAHQSESMFYRQATFFTAREVEALLREAGFSIDEWGQTLSRSLPEIRAIEPLQHGVGRGAFVVVRASTRR